MTKPSRYNKFHYKLGKKCPDCGKPIMDKATRCWDCTWIDRRLHPKKRVWRCTYCGIQITADHKYCKKCSAQHRLERAGKQPKVSKDRGYKNLFKPGHPNAHANGALQEHRFIVSEAIGRPLKPREVVDHKDKNKRNNGPANLLLFATTRDHQVYEYIRDFGIPVPIWDGANPTVVKERDS
ncbi:MAG TPA: HNH endonuclease [Candidatus Acidoferrum sp.]|nr:HNH endonuclease [Candidatus Acidoferrum sp.]